MPNYCLVCKEEGLKGYFGLPKDQETRIKWVNAVNLGDHYIDIENWKKSYRICYRHFDKFDLTYVGQRALVKSGNFSISFIFTF